jgi:TRAP-type C4-dicarboxylate transport system permease small subunit
MRHADQDLLETVALTPEGTSQALLRPGRVERACRLICEIAIVIMVGIVVAEIFTRNVLGFSMQLSDELGGYIIVGITFLSLSICHASGSYHHVEFIRARLPWRARLVLNLFFDLLSLAFSGILVWQMTRLELRSFQSGDAAPTILATPIWIPQITMAAGALALGWSVILSILARSRQLFR